MYRKIPKTGWYDSYMDSIEDAEDKGDIVYNNEAPDRFGHIDHKKQILNLNGFNTRDLGIIGSLTLGFIHQFRQKTEMLFLGPGAGRECYDAYALIYDSTDGRDGAINTVACTPIAPDIIPPSSCSNQLTTTEQFIQRQFIGKYMDIDLPTDLRCDWIYDQCGPLFHYNDKESYRKIVSKTIKHASATACIVQETLRQSSDTEVWIDLMGPDDVYICDGHRSSVLIRNARNFLGQTLPIETQDKEVFRYNLADILKELYEKKDLFIDQQ